MRRGRLTGYWLMLPAALWLGVFFVIPNDQHPRQALVDLAIAATRRAD